MILNIIITIYFIKIKNKFDSYHLIIYQTRQQNFSCQMENELSKHVAKSKWEDGNIVEFVGNSGRISLYGGFLEDTSFCSWRFLPMLSYVLYWLYGQKLMSHILLLKNMMWCPGDILSQPGNIRTSYNYPCMSPKLQGCNVPPCIQWITFRLCLVFPLKHMGDQRMCNIQCPGTSIKDTVY